MLNIESLDLDIKKVVGNYNAADGVHVVAVGATAQYRFRVLDITPDEIVVVDELRDTGQAPAIAVASDYLEQMARYQQGERAALPSELEHPLGPERVVLARSEPGPEPTPPAAPAKLRPRRTAATSAQSFINLAA
jgi:hypothetical protein